MLLALLTSNPAPVAAQADTTPWVEVNGDGIQMILTFARDVGCDQTAAAIQLNLPGDCGRPLTATNRFLVYGQNAWCNETECHADRAIGGIFAWPVLQIGDHVMLFDGGQLWAGYVIGMIYNIEHQREFDCPDGFTCGVLCTAVGRIPNWIVIRVAYKLAHPKGTKLSWSTISSAAHDEDRLAFSAW
jgi:hypothetical protein